MAFVSLQGNNRFTARRQLFHCMETKTIIDKEKTIINRPKTLFNMVKNTNTFISCSYGRGGAMSAVQLSMR